MLAVLRPARSDPAFRRFSASILSTLHASPDRLRSGLVQGPGPETGTRSLHAEQVTLDGNIGQKPEVRSIQNGTMIYNFSGRCPCCRPTWCRGYGPGSEPSGPFDQAHRLHRLGSFSQGRQTSHCCAGCTSRYDARTGFGRQARIYRHVHGSDAGKA